MEKKLPLFVFLLICFYTVSAQDVTIKGQPIDATYRRSSLYTILLESENFPYKETVIEAYYKAPFPDKYNNHIVGDKSFNPKLYGYRGKQDTTAYPAIINNYFEKNRVAGKLVAKWFNRQEDGTMDMNLIAERGAYNATEMDVTIAQSTARGVASLSDAGEELISNTFIVVSQLDFVSNEVFAAAAREVARISANMIPSVAIRELTLKGIDAVYEKAKEGYSVWTTAYLYKLAWNDSIAAVFYEDLWMDEPDPVRKMAFDSTNIFRMEYIGSEKARNIVTFSLKEQRSERRMVEIATIRNMDAVYAKLQKKYDVFKTKTPLLTVNPLTAKIGMKEGIEKGDRFEVLEMQVDAEGRTKYVRKGVIEVDKKRIWDNRFDATNEELEEEEVSEEVSESDPAEKQQSSDQSDRTYFKGGKNYYPGMLIRQIK